MANEVEYTPSKDRGNGVTTEFSFSWKVFKNEDVIVQLENATTGEQAIKTLGTDYSVSFNEVGGVVTFNSAPSSDYYVIISRDVSDYQSKRYSTSTGFQGSEIENSFDKVSCNIQEVEYTMKRAIKVPVGSSVLDLKLPQPDAGKTLKWNDTESGLENSTINIDNLEHIANRLSQSIGKVDIVADAIFDVTTVANDLNDTISPAIKTVANDLILDASSNIKIVSGNMTDISTVADDLDDTISAIKTVADDLNDTVSCIQEVGNNINDIITVADDLNDTISSIETVADDLNDSISSIETVANDLNDTISTIETVANDLILDASSNIKKVSDKITDVSTVADDLNDSISAVKTVADDLNDTVSYIQTVGGNIDDVSAVAEDLNDSISAIETVASDLNDSISAVKIVADDLNDTVSYIQEIGSHINDVIAVSQLEDEMDTIIGMQSNIQTCVTNMTDINNAATNAQTASDKASEASVSASSALGSANLAKDWANKIGSTVDGSEYSAKHYALQARDDSSVSYAQLMANLGYERTELLSDENLYRDAYKYAHSTFDSSKFTATGTPTIADGIASGFSSSNYYTANTTIDFTKPFKIVFNEKRGTATKFNGFHVGVSGSISTALLFVQSANTTTLTLGLYIGGTLTLNDYTFAHNDYTDINYIVSWDGTNYSLEVRNAISHETIMTQTVENSTAIENSSSSTGAVVYGYNFNSAVAITSTDLKQTSFDNGGVPIFSGNKTGTDTIILDNYTVVGSPTITDGVASGFSDSDYITSGNFKQNFGNANTWELEMFITLPSTQPNTTRYFVNGGTANSDWQGFVIGFHSDKRLRTFIGSTGTSWNIAYGKTSTDTFTLGSTIGVKLKFTGTQYIISSKEGNDDWKDQITVNSTTKIYNSNSGLMFGDNPANLSFTGSIDLNSIKVKENGKLKYMTNLSVPYVESVYNVPVVDSVYFDRVKTIYDRDDMAFYYVIDEANKKASIPLGSIYTYIYRNATEKLSVPDLVNGIAITGDSYTAPVKGYIIGSGDLSGGANFTIDDVVVGVTPFINAVIDKGQEFEISDTLTTQDIKFYPMKGA